ncbi:AAA family ATPase [bacterium]|nr:AAA family ATPase [candidate division CSSED10-310 bacterium]
MSDLKLYLFGKPRVEYRNQPLKLSRKSGMALLAYMAMTRTPHTREELMALFWPEAPAKQAGMHLRNALWDLNRHDVLRILDADRDSVSFASGRKRLWLDVAVFNEKRTIITEHHPDGTALCESCLASLLSAAALYTGTFMKSFSLRDSAEFDHWIMLQSHMLQKEFARININLVDHFIANREWPRAIEIAHKHLELIPSDETIHRSLMSIHAQTGHAAEAIRQYQICKALLEAELGTVPSMETDQLLHQIKTRTAEKVDRPSGGNGPPHPMIPFVGRDKELTDIRDLLTRQSTRLVTITGMGGSGKTRLAARTAELCRHCFHDGVAWVSLAGVKTGDRILPSINDALGIKNLREIRLPDGHRRTHADAPLARLLDYLRQRSILLILDNAEHLVSDFVFLLDIIRHAPHVKLLCTSRIRLNLRSEWVYELQGMTLENPVDPIRLGDAPALFEHCARRVDRHFRLTTDNMADVLSICRLLDGIPLAIELAAGWVNALPCRDIAREINDNLDFLVTTKADMPRRHRSFRTAVTHSWKLLTAEEHTAFRRLGVMQGTFTIESARHITGASLQDLTMLINKSMLRRNRDDRFSMHELLRRFALEKLEETTKEHDELRRRHAIHYLKLLHTLLPDLQGAGQKAALQIIRDDLDNVRIAWYRASETGLADALRQAILPMFIYCDILSLYEPGTEFFGVASRLRKVTGDTESHDSAPSLPGRSDDSAAANCVAAVALGLQGWFMRYNQRSAARACLISALEQLKPFGKTTEWALVYELLVFVDFETETVDAESDLLLCETIFTREGSDWGRAMTWEGLGVTRRERDPVAGRAAFLRSLTLRRTIGDAWGVAMSLQALASMDEESGDDASAWTGYQSSLNIRKRLEADWGGMIFCLLGMSRISNRAGNNEKTLQYLQEALNLAQKTVNPVLILLITEMIETFVIRTGTPGVNDD